MYSSVKNTSSSPKNRVSSLDSAEKDYQEERRTLEIKLDNVKNINNSVKKNLESVVNQIKQLLSLYSNKVSINDSDTDKILMDIKDLDNNRKDLVKEYENSGKNLNEIESELLLLNNDYSRDLSKMPLSFFKPILSDEEFNPFGEDVFRC
jgi:hypothetical protein